MDAGLTPTSPVERPAVPRRTAIAGAGAVAVTGAALAACGDSGGGAAPSQGTVLGKASDVEVGGGTIFKDAETVVTQQAEGQYQGFTAVCTHQGCIVDNITDGTINCKCHGSKYKLDGSVAQGPAAKPLAARKVTVNDAGELVTG